MKLSLAEAVCSTAGRDAERCFLVVALFDEQYVLISDGRCHKIQKPKKKKIKHLASLGAVDKEIAQKLVGGEQVRNKEIWAALAKINAEKGEE